MDIKQLKYFAAVADTLNFSRAAESLFISQSALSKQVADLEHELGIVLLKRDKRSVELTAAGQVFLDEAKAVLFRMDKIPSMVEHVSEHSEFERNLTIAIEARAANASVIMEGIAEAVRQMKTQIPGIRPLFFVDDYLKVNEMLKSGKADCAVLFTGTREELERQKNYDILYEEEMVLAYKQKENAEKSLKDILMQKDLFIIDRDFRGMAQIMRILGELGITPNIKFSDDFIKLLFILLSDEGCVIIPESLAAKIQHVDIECALFNIEESKITYNVIYNENEDDAPAKRVMQMAQNIIQKFD